jgi:hypothetical protein
MAGSCDESWSSIAVSLNCAFSHPLPLVRFGWKDKQPQSQIQARQTEHSLHFRRVTRIIDLVLIRLTISFHSTLPFQQQQH